jgi:hypothetical protein
MTALSVIKTDRENTYRYVWEKLAKLKKTRENSLISLEPHPPLNSVAIILRQIENLSYDPPGTKVMQKNRINLEKRGTHFWLLRKNLKKCRENDMVC